jgi:predicted SnoaL-like aldol condensation-catalyzing enzyme
VDRRAIIGLAALGMMAGGAANAAGGSGAANGLAKALVLDFYKLALTDRRPKDAFARFASADFVDHAASVPGGSRDDSAAALEALFAQMPGGKWTIVRSAAENDLVFLHVRVNPAPGAPEVAIAEIFRVQGDKIVEHWDVVASAPDKAVNFHSMV